MSQKYNLTKKIAYAAILSTYLGPNTAYAASSVGGATGKALSNVGQNLQKTDYVKNLVQNIVGGFAQGLIGAMTGVRDAVIGDESKRTPLYEKGTESWQRYFTAKGRRRAYIEKQNEIFIQDQLETQDLVDRLRKNGVNVEYKSSNQEKLEEILDNTRQFFNDPLIKAQIKQRLPDVDVDKLDFNRIKAELQNNPGEVMNAFKPYLPMLIQKYDSMKDAIDAGARISGRAGQTTARTQSNTSSSRNAQTAGTQPTTAQSTQPAASTTGTSQSSPSPKKQKKKINFAD